MYMLNQYKANQKHLDLITLVSLGSVPIVNQKLLEGWDPNVQNEDGVTPALEAAERNDLEMLSLLIVAGAKTDVADLAGYTPLKYAQINKNEEMIKLIETTLQSNSGSLGLKIKV